MLNKHTKDASEDDYTLEAASKDIISYFILLRAYPDDESTFLWRTYALILSCTLLSRPKIFKHSKRLSMKRMLKHTWYKHKTNVPYYMHQICSESDIPNKYVDVYALQQDIEKYFTWIFNKLLTADSLRYKTIVKYMKHLNF